MSVVTAVVMLTLYPTPHRVLARHRDQWASRGLEDYTMRLDVACFCEAGDLVVTVRDGSVSRVRLADGGPVIDARQDPSPHTIEDLFAVIEGGWALEEEHHVDVTYDAEWGYPAKISIYPVEPAMDAGVWYTVRSFVPAGGSRSRSG